MTPPVDVIATEWGEFRLRSNDDAKSGSGSSLASGEGQQAEGDDQPDDE
jgi:hypothetical protein